MTGSIDRDLTWISLLKTEDFKINSYGMMLNNHFMQDSERTTTIFIDSGTTFTYFPRNILKIIQLHFDWFCSVDTQNNCKGARVDIG